MLNERNRHFLCVGLLLVMARVPEVCGSTCVRSFRGIVYNTMHRREYTLHGARSSRYGQRYGKST